MVKKRDGLCYTDEELRRFIADEVSYEVNWEEKELRAITILGHVTRCRSCHKKLRSLRQEVSEKENS